MTDATVVGDWNFDMTLAPKGETQTKTIIVDGKERKRTEHHVSPVWLATASGNVHRSYWVPETRHMAGHWSGFNVGADVIAWKPFIVPVHPSASKIEVPA